MRILLVRFFIAIIVVLALSQHWLAGQEPPATPPAAEKASMPHGRVEHQLERMKETLNVTDDQVAKIRPILETREQQLKDLRANYSLSQGEARAKAAEIRKSARKQVEHILTQEQRQKQKALRRGRNAGS